jgi:hypothetical protein
LSATDYARDAIRKIHHDSNKNKSERQLELETQVLVLSGMVLALDVEWPTNDRSLAGYGLPPLEVKP